MDSALLTDRVLPEDFAALRGVGKHFDEVYTKMVEYAREHDIESTKRKPERFPSAIGEILQQVLGTDYDILNPQADEPIKIEREYLFVMFLCSYVEVYGERTAFRYRDVEDMCAVNASYESFKERTPDEQAKLVAYANWMSLAMKFRRPNANKGSLLISIPIAAELRNHTRYITGTGATRSTKDRIGVFEVEGQTSPAPRPNRRREDEYTSPAKPSSSATKSGGSASRGSASRGSGSSSGTKPTTSATTPSSATRSGQARVKSENSRETRSSSSTAAAAAAAAPQPDDSLQTRLRENRQTPTTPKIKEERREPSQEPEFEFRAPEVVESKTEDDGGEWAFDETLLEDLAKEQPAGYVPSYASQLLQETKLATDFVPEEEDEALVRLVANWDLQKVNDIEKLFDIESR